MVYKHYFVFENKSDKATSELLKNLDKRVKVYELVNANLLVVDSKSVSDLHEALKVTETGVWHSQYGFFAELRHSAGKELAARIRAG